MLTEGPAAPNAKKIPDPQNTSLSRNHEVGLYDLLNYFTIVMDSAAVMARVGNASVNQEQHTPTETWMG